MKVVLSQLAESKLIALTEYLLTDWNVKVRNDFVKKLNSKIEQISIQPNSCLESKAFKGLYKCVVTKQTTFYYVINLDLELIEIITFFDTGQNPNKLIKEV